jgi:hypothetical protein
VPKNDKYVPKHRSTPSPSVRRLPRRALRNTVVLSSIAAAATGVTVSGGVLGTPEVSSAADELTGASYSSGSELGSADLERRDVPVSRSDRRTRRDPAKAAVLAMDEGPAVTREEDLSSAHPRDIARALLPEYGFSADQFGCLDSLYVSESDWRTDADNPTSSAYGIPQALTETHDVPPGYFTDAEVQIRWGLDYIRDSYGTPCNAWAFKQGNNWY